MNQKTEILDQINHLIKKLEEETSQKYEAKLRSIENETIVLNDFKKRGPYSIQSLPEELKELEGEYQTYEEMKEKIRELSLPYYVSQTTNEKWQCIKCHQWRKIGL